MESLPNLTVESDSDSSSDSSYDKSESKQSGSSLAEGSVTRRMESLLQRLDNEKVDPPQPTAGGTLDPIEKYKETIDAGSKKGVNMSGAKRLRPALAQRQRAPGSRHQGATRHVSEESLQTLALATIQSTSLGYDNRSIISKATKAMSEQELTQQQ